MWYEGDAFHCPRPEVSSLGSTWPQKDPESPIVTTPFPKFSIFLPNLIDIGVG